MTAAAMSPTAASVGVSPGTPANFSPVGQTPFPGELGVENASPAEQDGGIQVSEVLPPTEMEENDENVTPSSFPARSSSGSGTGEGIPTAKPLSHLSVFEVGTLLEDLTGDAEIGNRFRSEEIDGAALLLLTESMIDQLVGKVGHKLHLMRFLGLIGPISRGTFNGLAASSPRDQLFGLSERTCARAKPCDEILQSQREKRQRQLENLASSGKGNADGSAGRKRQPGVYDFDETKVNVRRHGESVRLAILDRKTDMYIARSKCTRASDVEAFERIAAKYKNSPVPVDVNEDVNVLDEDVDAPAANTNAHGGDDDDYTP